MVWIGAVVSRIFTRCIDWRILVMRTLCETIWFLYILQFRNRNCRFQIAMGLFWTQFYVTVLYGNCHDILCRLSPRPGYIYSASERKITVTDLNGRSYLTHRIFKEQNILICPFIEGTRYNENSPTEPKDARVIYQHYSDRPMYPAPRSSLFPMF